MKAVIVGAGVVGMATAYCLVKRGIDVVVVDRHASAGEGTSKGNGAQLCYNYVAPLAGPGVIGKLPAWLTDRDSPVRFVPKPDPHQWAWCLRFLLRCNRDASRAASEKLLALSAVSSRMMADFRRDIPVDFDYSDLGKLVVYSSADSFAAARRQVAFQRTLGSVQEAISVERCLQIEPALQPMRDKLVGAIFTPGDHTADAHLFCRHLAAWLAKRYANFSLRTGTVVASIANSNGRAVGVTTDQGDIEADHVVLATGIETNALLKSVKLRVPIYPIRGYSITVPAPHEAARLKLSVTDYDQRIVYAPLGERLRVAGIADIGGYEKTIDLRRIALLLAQTQKVFPVAPHSDVSPWCGLRPATPSGLPICGQSALQGLHLNVGHGALGWTLALATGDRVAGAIADTNQELTT